MRTGDPQVHERLIEAGLLAAIEESEQKAVHIRSGSRLAFEPKPAVIAYEDRSGEAPCAADFVVHLDLLHRAVDAHAAAVASLTGRHGGSRSAHGGPRAGT